VLHDAQAGQPCRSLHLLAQQREDLLWQDVGALLRHPRQMAYALERVHGGPWLPQEFQARKAAQHKERANLDSQVDRLTQADLAEIIPLEGYQRRRQTLEENIQAVETRSTLLETQGDCQAAVIGLMTSLAALTMDRLSVSSFRPPCCPPAACVPTSIATTIPCQRELKKRYPRGC
jgi:hypothetical protein